MNLTLITKKYEADKLVLLGLFVLGLLIARYISLVRYDLPRKAGDEVISAIKARGISDLLNLLGHENFYLVKNTRGRTIGFSIDIFTDSTTSTGVKINAAGHFYMLRGAIEHLMVFEGDDVIKEFSWKTDLLGSGLDGRSEISLDANGMMTIGGGGSKGHSFPLTSPAIPKFMLDFVVSQMLQTGQKRIIVEVIDFDGAIKPVRISQVKKGLVPSGTEAGHVLKLELPNENRVSKLIFVDDQGLITKVVMRREGLILERSTIEAVLRRFPGKAGYLLQKKKIPQGI